MPTKILDTSALVKFWYDNSLYRKSATVIRKAAQQLIEILGTDAILTPVRIEMIAGTRSKRQLELTRVFLSEFQVIDNGKIIPEDWKETERLAARAPRDGKPRHLGDCLIRAIANRLRCEVISHDRYFRPRQTSS